jgi:UDP-N-acetylglucosamine:LPS N-acetylglucosamine transferase
MKQKDLTSELLAEQLNTLFSEPSILPSMAQSAFAAADAEATHKVAAICQQLVAA